MNKLLTAIRIAAGCLFLFIALGALASASVLAGIFMLLGGLLLIPKSAELIESFLPFQLSPSVSAGVVLMCFIGTAITFEDSESTFEDSESPSGSAEIASDSRTESETNVSSLTTAESGSIEAWFNYPAMGTPYSEISDVCSSEPRNRNGMADSHYECSRPGGRYVFGPDRNLKALTFKITTGHFGDYEQLLSEEDWLGILDSRYGQRVVSSSGVERFTYQNQDSQYTAVSYGCRAYYDNKPGMQVPGGTPATHRSIWEETGWEIPRDPDGFRRPPERLDFEVVKSEVQNAESCVVALVNHGKSNIPTGINEEQLYFSRVDILEVDANFSLFNDKYW